MLIGTKWTAPATGTLTTLTAYALCSSGNLGLGVYSDNSGSPNNLLASGTVAFPHSAAWVSVTISLAVTSGTVYWLSWQALANAGANPDYYYNSGGGSNQLKYVGTTTDFKTPFPSPSAQNWFISEYATYQSTVPVTFTSSPATGTGYITVNGSAQTTPYTIASANVGDTYTIAANSPANLVSGQSQYVYSSWNDSGAQSHTITVSTATTYTASFQLQYYLTVTGGSSPTGQGWVNSGGTTTASNAWVWSIVASQKQAAITNYAIDGANQNPTRAYSGTLTTSTITMSTYHTVAFTNTTQYNFVVTSTYDSPTGQAYYDTGTSISSTVTTPSSGYQTSGWTGTGSLSSGGSTGSSTTGSFTITAYSTCTWNWVGSWTKNYFGQTNSVIQLNTWLGVSTNSINPFGTP
jgi:hypothetical protein